MKRILQNSGKAKGKCLMPVDKYINEGIMCLSIRRNSENWLTKKLTYKKQIMLIQDQFYF